MLQAGSTSEQVVGNVQHMIRFTVGQVPLEQRHGSIDGVHQSQALHHVMDHAEAAAGDSRRTLRNFIVYVLSGKNWPRSLKLRLIQPTVNLTLASGEILL